jgi:hypothetical protein
MEVAQTLLELPEGELELVTVGHLVGLGEMPGGWLMPSGNKMVIVQTLLELPEGELVAMQPGKTKMAVDRTLLELPVVVKVSV